MWECAVSLSAQKNAGMYILPLALQCWDSIRFNRERHHAARSAPRTVMPFLFPFLALPSSALQYYTHHNRRIRSTIADCRGYKIMYTTPFDTILTLPVCGVLLSPSHTIQSHAAGAAGGDNSGNGITKHPAAMMVRRCVTRRRNKV